MSKIILSKSFINNSVKLALNEDLYPAGDITSNLIKKSSIKTFKIIANQNGIIGGIEFAKSTFKVFDKKIQFHVKKKDGSQIKNGQIVAVIKDFECAFSKFYSTNYSILICNYFKCLDVTFLNEI